MASETKITSMKVHKFKTQKQLDRAILRGLVGDNDIYMVEEQIADKSAESITLQGDVTGQATSTGGWTINTTLPSITDAKEIGPEKNEILSQAGTFSVPQLTIDEKGRVISATNIQYRLPASDNGQAVEQVAVPSFSIVGKDNTLKVVISNNSTPTPVSYSIYVDSYYLTSIEYMESGTEYDIWPILREKGVGTYNIQVEAISSTGFVSQQATQSFSVTEYTFYQGDHIDYSLSNESFSYTFSRECLTSFFTNYNLIRYDSNYVPTIVLENRSITIDFNDEDYWVGSTEIEVLYDYWNDEISAPALARELLIISSNYCLAAGTQILMADGTSKAIEDVRRGDKIKSYDLATGELIDVNCIGAGCSGFDTTFRTMSFNNNSYLRIAKSHQVYNKTNNRLMPNRLWKADDCGICADGSTIRMTDQVTTIFSEQIKHYILVSENCLYFANGILTGHSIQTLGKAGRELKNLFNYSDEEIAAIQAEAELTDKEEKWNKDPEFKRLCAERSTTPDKLKKEIASIKVDLAARDYKTIKRMQGLIPDDEWEENLVACAAMRARINEAEAELQTEIQFRREARVACGYPATARPEHIRFRENHKVVMDALKSRNARL